MLPTLDAAVFAVGSEMCSYGLSTLFVLGRAGSHGAIGAAQQTTEHQMRRDRDRVSRHFEPGENPRHQIEIHQIDEQTEDQPDNDGHGHPEGE